MSNLTVSASGSRVGEDVPVGGSSWAVGRLAQKVAAAVKWVLGKLMNVVNWMLGRGVSEAGSGPTEGRQGGGSAERPKGGGGGGSTVSKVTDETAAAVSAGHVGHPASIHSAVVVSSANRVPTSSPANTAAVTAAAVGAGVVAGSSSASGIPSLATTISSATPVAAVIPAVSPLVATAAAIASPAVAVTAAAAAFVPSIAPLIIPLPRTSSPVVAAEPTLDQMTETAIKQIENEIGALRREMSEGQGSVDVRTKLGIESEFGYYGKTTADNLKEKRWNSQTNTWEGQLSTFYILEEKIRTELSRNIPAWRQKYWKMRFRVAPTDSFANGQQKVIYVQINKSPDGKFPAVSGGPGAAANAAVAAALTSAAASATPAMTVTTAMNAGVAAATSGSSSAAAASAVGGTASSDGLTSTGKARKLTRGEIEGFITQAIPRLLARMEAAGEIMNPNGQPISSLNIAIRDTTLKALFMEMNFVFTVTKMSHGGWKFENIEYSPKNDGQFKTGNLETIISDKLMKEPAATEFYLHGVTARGTSGALWSRDIAGGEMCGPDYFLGKFIIDRTAN